MLKTTYPEPWNYYVFQLQFSDQKALFKVPKICNIIFFLLKMTPPPPLALFQKIIRFGSRTLPLATLYNVFFWIKELDFEIGNYQTCRKGNPWNWIQYLQEKFSRICGDWATSFDNIFKAPGKIRSTKGGPQSTTDFVFFVQFWIMLRWGTQGMCVAPGFCEPFKVSLPTKNQDRKLSQLRVTFDNRPNNIKHGGCLSFHYRSLSCLRPRWRSWWVKFH